MSEKRKTCVINIIGGPGLGKTTMAALIFANLKKKGFIVEYVQEYAKKLVWQKKFSKLNINIFPKRGSFPYETDGHMQTKEEAKQIDVILEHILDGLKIPYKKVDIDDITSRKSFLEETKAF